MSYSVKATRSGTYLIFHDQTVVGSIRQTPSGYAVDLGDWHISLDDSLTPVTDGFTQAVSHLSKAA